MNKVLCCLAQSGALVAGLVFGTQAFAQEPGPSGNLSATPKARAD